MASIINAATSGGLISTADTSGILQLQTAGTTAVTVNASQNVGIGTSSPSYKLDVSGSGRVTTSFSVGGAPTGYGVLQAISDDANTAPRQISIRGTTNGNKNLFLGFNTTSDYGAIQAIIDGTGTVPLVLQPSGGNLGLGVTPSAWGSNWRAINFGYTSGIGQLAATSGGSGEVSLVSSAYNNNTNWLYYYTGAQASKYSQTSGQHQWFTAGTGTAGNAITFTQAMTLDASGNLGIGTTSPSHRLDVQSGSSPTIRIRNSAVADGNISKLLFEGSNNFSGTSTSFIQSIALSGGNSNTALVFGTNAAGGGAAAEVMRLDQSGNLGLGVTPSTWSTGKAFEIGATGNGIWNVDNNNIAFTQNAYFNTTWKYARTQAASFYDQNQGVHRWFNAASGTAGNAITFTQAMTLDASGNLGVGTTSPTTKLDVTGNSANSVGTAFSINNKSQTTQNLTFIMEGASGDGQPDWTNSAIIEAYQPTASTGTKALYLSAYNGPIIFATNARTQAARIDSSGNLLVGVTSGSVHTLSKNNSNDIAAQINNTSSSNCYGLRIQTTAVASNSASFYLLRCADSSATRADIRADGGLANYSANNANLSDQRVKTDIQNAGGYLAKICAIPVRTFKYKNQTDDLLNLGCIAQEVEAVAPELVDASGFGETPEDGVPLKAIYQTDLQYALMKALQELKAEFDAYKASHP